VKYSGFGLSVVAATLVAVPAVAEPRDISPPIAATTSSNDLATPELEQRVLAGTHWRLMTDRGPVHVWIPSGYDRQTAATVVFVHGYGTDVDSAWNDYRLPEQFARSGVNAMFVACGAPASPNRPMVWPSLSALLLAVKAGISQPLPAGELVAVGHSAAYRTLVLWLANPVLRTLVLLDAAYGETDQFLAWTRADNHHRLINVASDTIPDSNLMHAFLPTTKRIDGLPVDGWPDEARMARVLYVRTDVGHIPMITGGVALPLALGALQVALLRQ
jgi:hypothetical protein